MNPEDLEPRLRRAFDEVSSAWQPNGSAATDFVKAVSRRRARQRRNVVTIGCAVGAVLALAAGTGIYSTARTDTRETSSASLLGPTRSTVSRSTAVFGLPKGAALPQQQVNPTLKCAKVTVEAEASQCSGVYLATSSVSSGLSAQNSAAATASPTSTAATVTVEVGQHVTVALPATTSGSWNEPTAVDASRLSPMLRQELPVSQHPTDPGVVRVVGRARRAANQSVTAVFEAIKAGDVVLMSMLAHGCERTSIQQAEIASPTCPGISTQWFTVLVIVPR